MAARRLLDDGVFDGVMVLRLQTFFISKSRPFQYGQRAGRFALSIFARRRYHRHSKFRCPALCLTHW